MDLKKGIDDLGLLHLKMFTYGNSRKGIIHTEPAGSRNFHPERFFLLFSFDLKGNAKFPGLIYKLQIFCMNICRFVKSVGLQPACVPF